MYLCLSKTYLLLLSLIRVLLIGTNCETDIDECASDPCLYGECEDLVADYQCNCEPGITTVRFVSVNSFFQLSTFFTPFEVQYSNYQICVWPTSDYGSYSSNIQVQDIHLYYSKSYIVHNQSLL